MKKIFFAVLLMLYLWAIHYFTIEDISLTISLKNFINNTFIFKLVYFILSFWILMYFLHYFELLYSTTLSDENWQKVNKDLKETKDLLKTIGLVWILFGWWYYIVYKWLFTKIEYFVIFSYILYVLYYMYYFVLTFEEHKIYILNLLWKWNWDNTNQENNPNNTNK